jgi:DNA-3-methyladenine glycosylase II
MKAVSKFLIKKPALFSFRECLWFLDRNLDDCMHTVTENSVLKLLAIDGKPTLVEISEEAGNIAVEVLAGNGKNKNEITGFITEWFDLDTEIRPFYGLLHQDKDLAPLASLYRGLRIIGIPDFFEVLCWCVIGQQINLQFAYKVKRRLVEKYGKKLRHEGQTHYLFPTPDIVSKISVEAFRDLQLTTRKAEYLRGIAQLFLEGKLSKKMISDLKDEKLMIDRLKEIRGIGEWTANYAIMKGLRARNGVPYGDSGLNQALYHFKGIPKKNNRPEVDALFDCFEGWKTYLVFYLWRSLRNQAPA